jgi:membrane-anchored glycerophosphoryl diester phosphodiesterase (GDPDase)
MLPAIVIERASCFRAMVRSWHLTRHAFWRTAGFLCAVSLCYYCCILIPQNLVSYLLQQQTVALVVRYSSLILATPIISLAYTVYYYDARVRNEGYDLDLQIQQMLIELALPQTIVSIP